MNYTFDFLEKILMGELHLIVPPKSTNTKLSRNFCLKKKVTTSKSKSENKFLKPNQNVKSSKLFNTINEIYFLLSFRFLDAIQDKIKRKVNDLSIIVQEILKDLTFISYTDLWTKLIEEMDVIERTAKGYIRFMIENQILIQSEKDKQIRLKK